MTHHWIIGPTICGYSSGCRLWASISRSFDHERAQSECICKCVQIRFILTYGCKWVFSLVFTATSTVWLKNLYLNMLSWYDVSFNSKLTTGHFFVDHFVKVEPGIWFSTINCVFSLRTMHSLTRYSKDLPTYSLIPNKSIGWNNSIGRQNFQKLIIGEGGTISNKRVGWQKFRKLINRESLIMPA